MVQVDHTVGVCLYKLDAREEAVLKRVVTFNGAQGRHYVLAELAAAQLVVVSNDTTVDLAAMHAGAMLIRITDQDSEQPYDVLMQRPLLVTRVMRSLDDARKLWADSLALSAAKATEATHSLVESAPSESVKMVEAPAQAVVEVVLAPEPVVTQNPAIQPSGEQQVTEVVASSLAAEPVEDKKTVEIAAPATPPHVELTITSVLEQTPPAPTVPTSIIEPTSNLGGEYHHRALVVDDSAAIRKQLELELREAGIAADFAETGEEALQKVTVQAYDLVFLDIIMPGIDGYETCRQMRLRKEMKKTPIIMLSAKTSPLDEVQGVIAGASTYLTKPVKSEQLQKTLKRVAMWLDNFQQARV
ncbi:response regulator [uncultured Thiothrix sp.]|uniref:response regulator transcription factor n=1 Tax=uncultured Thiothrix sp. TaxID=223185 RepID=UPI00262ADD97|nr:response regulator [uncultured Thiothrix sp.]HMT92759.1 response regulator [Thiolinea sp.]